MYSSKHLLKFFLLGLVILCFLLSILFEFKGNKDLSYYLHSLTAPLITISYLIFVKQKNKYFLLFLLTYSLADFTGVITSNITDKTAYIYDFDYYGVNGLYVLSYVFLNIKIIKSLDFLFLLKSFKIHLVVLSILIVYFLYVLQNLIHSNLMYENDFYLEFAYNIVILFLLSFALLNYFHKDNKKALYLFTGALFIVFSEVMDVAFMYVVDRPFIKILSLTFAIFAFYFFYEQSKLLNTSNKESDYIY